MATSKETIELILKGVDQTGAAFKSVDRNVRSLSSSASNLTGPIAGVTKTLLGMEAAAIAVALALGKNAFQASVKYETALSDLTKVLTEQEQNLLPGVEEQLGKLSLQYGRAGTELIQSTANFRQAGFDLNESVALTKNALDLVIAGDIEAAQASDLLVASLKGFGVEASSAGGIIDLLNETSNNFATNLQELAIGFAELSPVAQSANLSFEDTVGILTPAIEVFRSGSESARAFRTILLRLSDPTDKIRDAFKFLGIETNNLDGSLKSSRDILFELAPAFNQVDAAQRTQLASVIAGKDQAGKFLAVMQDFNKTLEISSGVLDVAGSATKEVEIRLKTAENTIARTEVAFSQLSRVIGDKYRVELAGVIGATGELATAGRNLVTDGSFDRFFNLLGPNLVSLQKAIESVAENLPEAFAGVDFDGLVDAIQDLGFQVKELFGFDVTSTEGLRDALQGIVNGIEGLTRFSAGAVEGLAPLVKTIFESVDVAQESGREFANLAGQIGGTFTAINTLLPAIDLLSIAIIGIAGVKGIQFVAAGFSLAANSISAAGVAAGGAATTFGALAAGLGTLAGVLGVGGLTFLLTKFGLEATGTNLAINDLVDKMTGLDKAASGLETPITRADLAIKDTGENAGEAGTKVKDLSDQLINWADELPGVVRDVKNQNVELDKQGQLVGRASKSYENYLAAISGAAPITAEIVEQWREQNDEAEKLETSTAGVIRTMEDGVATFTQVAKSNKRVTDTLQDLADKSVISKDKYAELVTEIEKKKIEAKVELDIAQLEANADIAKTRIDAFAEITTAKIELDIARVQADTDRVKSIIGGISDVSSTVSGNISDVVKAIAGLDGADSLAKQKFEIFTNQLDLENARFDQLIANQTKIVDAQAAKLLAEAERLRNGIPLITVKGEGLVPHMKAFMFELLELIQIEANADGQQYLLGLPTS